MKNINNKGWKEAPGADGIAPLHRIAALKDVQKPLSVPMQKELPDANKIWSELPYDIRKHASIEGSGIKVVLIVMEGQITDGEEVKKLPTTKKWLKEHGFGYDDRGYWWLDTKISAKPIEYKIQEIDGKKWLFIISGVDYKTFTQLIKEAGLQKLARFGKNWATTRIPEAGAILKEAGYPFEPEAGSGK